MLTLLPLLCALWASAVPVQAWGAFNLFKPGSADTCKNPKVVVAQDSFRDTPLFFRNFDKNLQKRVCSKFRKIASDPDCKEYSFDVTYSKIFYYLANACKNDYSKPRYLRRLVLQYCAYHCTNQDQRVEEAFECATGCRIADALNQLCKSRFTNLKCPAGYTLFPGTSSCYKFFGGQDETNFFDARNACEHDVAGGQLVQIDSKDENDFVYELLGKKTNDTRMFLGLNDVASEGDFRWATSNQLLGYDNWGPNQPDDSPDSSTIANCVVMNIGRPDKTDAAWNDISKCDTVKWPYMCEVDPLP